MKRDLKGLVLTALFLTLLIVSSQIYIPSTVPFTLQTFVLFLSSHLLGRKKAVCVLSLYILMGLLSLPVFSGFLSGAGVFLTHRGGFLLGFFPLVLLSSARKGKFVFSVAGLFICHLCAVLWISLLYSVPIVLSFVTYSLPFILKDVLCCVLSLLLCEKIKKAGVF